MPDISNTLLQGTARKQAHDHITGHNTSMIIDAFDHFTGHHCETTATGTLLKQIGIELSEPMLFGLGEGLGYIVWNMTKMDTPFIGGRVKPDSITETLCKHLNLRLEVTETTSISKAWECVSRYIDQGKAVGLKLDCYHLDYFSSRFHFAGHYVAMYGYDDTFAYLVDTVQQGEKVRTTLDSLALARNERGPMSSRNKAYVIYKDSNNTSATTSAKTTVKHTSQDAFLKKVVMHAMNNNATAFLNPPIKNIGYKGIKKTSSEIKKWFKNGKNIKREFQTIAMLMEKGGTGGSLFRNMYRDFLRESATLLASDDVYEVYLDYKKIAKQWKIVSDVLYKVGETQDSAYIHHASELLTELSQSEYDAMTKLKRASTTGANESK